MSDTAGKPQGLEEYAKAHGLTYANKIGLPTSGSLLGESNLSVHGTAAGLVSGSERGALCYLHYTYHADDVTHSVDRTAVVVRVPESMGFAPYLGSGRVALGDMKTVKLDGGGSVIADSAINDTWLAELLSPAFAEWLARNPDDFEWELSEGVLCASRQGHISDETQLTALCDDTAHIATTVRQECLEEVDLGEAKRTAAKATQKKEKAGDQLATLMLAKTTFAKPPTDVASSRSQFREQIVRHPSTYAISLWRTLLIMLGINIIGGGLYGLLLNLGNPGRAVIIYQVILFVIVFPLVLRGQINGLSEKLSTQGFWREYIRSHQLTEEDPTTFAATHAKANLPGAPVRVLSGMLGGVNGSLMLTGDGDKRGDVIALVGGETGPVASAAFDVSAPGPSTAALDSYVEKLAGELRTQTA